MNEKKRIRVVDTHTEGEPTRVIIRRNMPPGCLGALDAREIFERTEKFTRTAILQEPRGHRDQFGSVVYPSKDEETDFTVFFLTTDGFLDMCAHATIGTTTALVHDGMIHGSDENRIIRYNTPAGNVEVSVIIEDGEATSVTLKNVPSFYLGKTTIRLEDNPKKELSVDLAFGGNFYSIVDSEELGIKVEQENIDLLRSIGSTISKAVRDQIGPVHPENSSISPSPLTMITGDPKLNHENYRNIVIFPNGSFDRSPCGTGTSARASVLFDKGEIGLEDSFTHESITDTTFRCTVKGTTKVGRYEAIIPEITGRAWVTQISEVIINNDDPLTYGFLVE